MKRITAALARRGGDGGHGSGWVALAARGSKYAPEKATLPADSATSRRSAHRARSRAVHCPRIDRSGLVRSVLREAWEVRKLSVLDVSAAKAEREADPGAVRAGSLDVAVVSEVAHRL